MSNIKQFIVKNPSICSRCIHFCGNYTCELSDGFAPDDPDCTYCAAYERGRPIANCDNCAFREGKYCGIFSNKGTYLHFPLEHCCHHWAPEKEDP